MKKHLQLKISRFMQCLWVPPQQIRCNSPTRKKVGNNGPIQKALLMMEKLINPPIRSILPINSHLQVMISPVSITILDMNNPNSWLFIIEKSGPPIRRANHTKKARRKKPIIRAIQRIMKIICMNLSVFICLKISFSSGSDDVCFQSFNHPTVY